MSKTSKWILFPLKIMRFFSYGLFPKTEREQDKRTIEAFGEALE